MKRYNPQIGPLLVIRKKCNQHEEYTESALRFVSKNLCIRAIHGRLSGDGPDAGNPIKI